MKKTLQYANELIYDRRKNVLFALILYKMLKYL